MDDEIPMDLLISALLEQAEELAEYQNQKAQLRSAIMRAAADRLAHHNDLGDEI